MMRVVQKNAMVIDDDYTNRFLGEKILRSFTSINSVLSASNGIEALELLDLNCIEKNEVPDIIVLDVHMPVMNGFQFLKKFGSLDCLKDKRKPVILMISSSSDPQDEECAKALGVRYYFAKPISPDYIRDVLRQEFF